nr:uncharacterized protein LOC110376985 isoform X3 [Helicoverpa armigera]
MRGARAGSIGRRGQSAPRRATESPRRPAMRARALLFLLVVYATYSHAEKSKFYYMDSLCKDHFLQRQYRKVDGGVLWSRNERNLDCTVTFQTHSILQRFMLHFDLLQLDCNDHLYVYDGAHATAPPKADLSCRNTKQQVGALFTRSNFVTLKYVTDNWGTDANGFRLVITAVKDPIPEHGCKEFRCKQREFCVSADLMCDGVDHCADGSDEDTAALCPESGGTGASGAWVAGIAGAAALLAVVAAGVACCACRRRAANQRTRLHPVPTDVKWTPPANMETGVANALPTPTQSYMPVATSDVAPGRFTAWNVDVVGNPDDRSRN